MFLVMKDSSLSPLRLMMQEFPDNLDNYRPFLKDLDLFVLPLDAFTAKLRMRLLV